MNEQKKLVPKLRFPEFQGAKEWASAPMGSVYSFKGNNSLSRDKLNYVAGSLKNIHYGDIHTKFATHFDITKELLPFINKSEEGFTREENLCVEGDMVFADASEDLADIGKSIELMRLNGERVVSGLHTIVARRLDERIALGFGGHLFKSGWVRTQIQKEAQGAKVLGISPTRLRNLLLPLPHAPAEQQKIADCLSSLDELIAVQARKVEALKNHKKGVMQQLFPREGETQPRLQFPEFQGKAAWLKWPGDKLFEQISDKNTMPGLPVLAITQEHGAIPRSMIDYHVSVTDKSIESYKVVQVGDFIISLRSFQGGIEYSQYLGICSPAYVVLRRRVEGSNTYFKHYLKTDRFIQILTKNLEGLRDGKMISYKQFCELQIPIASPNEQKKIAECLSSLDNLVTTATQELEFLKIHKNGLMQLLFPSLEVVKA
jgi:type I restriction enzyme S subunit